MKFFLEWLCMRCPMNQDLRNELDRRRVSPEGRSQWEAFTQERADVERRLELVDMQTKFITYVTNK